MPVLGLFNYRKFLFQRLKVLIARIFQVVKPFCFTNVGSVRNFTRVVSRNSARVQNYSNCLLVLRKKISSAFRVQRCEPRSFAKCWQNLLIEKKSVERLWRFSKGWT
jgi:hypothetical protein